MNFSPWPIVFIVNEILLLSFIAVVVAAPPANVATLFKLEVKAVARSVIDPVWITEPFNPDPTADPEKPTTFPTREALKVPLSPEVLLISSTNPCNPVPVYVNVLNPGASAFVSEPDIIIKSTRSSDPTILKPAPLPGILPEKSNEAVEKVPVALPLFANILVDVAFVNAPGVTLVTNNEVPPSAKYFCALIEVKNSNWSLPERKVVPNFSL